MKTTDSSAQDDLAEILRTVGLSDSARPYSCHEVVHKDLLPHLRAMMRDAARYQFLRDKATEKQWVTARFLTAGALDTAIDSALSAATGERAAALENVMTAPNDTPQDELTRLDGLFVGQLDHDEMRLFREAIQRGEARRDYDHTSGILGIAKVKVIRHD